MAPKHQTRVQGIFFNLSVVSIWFSGILLLELIPGWLILMLKFVHYDLLFLVTREETETPKLHSLTADRVQPRKCLVSKLWNSTLFLWFKK